MLKNKSRYAGLLTIGVLAVLLAKAAIGYPQSALAGDEHDGGAAAAAAAAENTLSRS
jgi:hypothetical protein